MTNVHSARRKSLLKSLLPERIPALGAMFYNWLPARMFRPHYELIAGELPIAAGDCVVDLGTGPGYLPIAIAKRHSNVHVIGVDLSEKMIEIARKNLFREGSFSNVEFRLMDGKALEFPDNSIDFFISTGTSHHWKEPVRVLDEIHRCLKPGREAWIYDGYGEATDEAIKKSTRKVFLGFPPCWFVRRIMSIHGFRQTEYDTIVKDIISRSKFGAAEFQVCNIMMCIRLKKQ